MPLWHILLTRGERTLMDEIKSAFDVLARLGERQAEINKAIDRVTEANAELTAKQVGFGELMQQAEALMAANPTVEAVECGGTGQVLVRLPSGSVSVLALSHWYSLGMPPQAVPDPPVIPADEAQVIFERLGNHLTRNGGGFVSLSVKQLDSLIPQPAHDRIQAGTTTEADRDMMALSHAWADTFGDPAELDEELMAREEMG